MAEIDDLSFETDDVVAAQDADDKMFESSNAVVSFVSERFKRAEDADLYDMLLVDKETGVMSVDPRVDNFNRLDFINLLQGLARRTNQTKG